jgi:large subunit ribosomal protein L18
MAQITRKAARQRLHRRLRKKVVGTVERPRLTVNFSGRHIHAQIVDDGAGCTLVAVSTVQGKDGKDGKALRCNVASATEVGRRMASQALEKNIRRVVFDRGGFTYHGKVKALADAAREAGLEF